MSLEQSILATLTYSDVFDYPLKAKEIYKFLIGQKVELAQITDGLSYLVKENKLNQKDNFYFLPERDQIVKSRIDRIVWAKKKIKKAKMIASILKVFPQIKLVGVSGGLAMENAKFDDDIDFFIITTANRLWTARFLSTATLSFLRQRRDLKGAKVVNKICLNMYIDELDLEIRPHDLYLAHEVAQMLPIWQKDNVYKKFIKKNDWIFNFLPNWQSNLGFKYDDRQNYHNLVWGKIIEKFLRSLQLQYMSSKRTTEKISPTKIQFHPNDAHQKVLDDYQKRIESLKII